MILLRAWYMPWLRQLVARLSARRHGFSPSSLHVGIVVKEVSLGQGFLRVALLRFSAINTARPFTTLRHVSNLQLCSTMQCA